MVKNVINFFTNNTHFSLYKTLFISIIEAKYENYYPELYVINTNVQ